MLLSRYGNAAVLNEPFHRAAQIIMKAYEKTADEKLFFRWVTNYEKYISFDEFKNCLKGDDRSADEILDDVKDILDKAVI